MKRETMVRTLLIVFAFLSIGLFFSTGANAQDSTGADAEDATGAHAGDSTGAGAEDSTDPARPCRICEFRKTLFADTRQAFTEPARWDRSQRRTVIRNSLIVVGTMALLDEPVRDFAQDRGRNRFEPFGTREMAGVVLGYAIVGKLADRPRARQTALDSAMSSIIASGLLVPALKEITGRSRPRTDLGASDFHPFSGNESFPSGHASAAFAIAASVAENTDHRWVKGLSYGLATLVGLSRIDVDAHWISDTTAGALIGIGVAKSVAATNRERRGLAMTPTAVPEGWGIAFTKPF